MIMDISVERDGCSRMGEINIPQAEQKAISSIDSKELYRLVDRAKRIGHAGELRQYLRNCGLVAYSPADSRRAPVADSAAPSIKPN
jgi:hypothetical protein